MFFRLLSLTLGSLVFSAGANADFGGQLTGAKVSQCQSADGKVLVHVKSDESHVDLPTTYDLTVKVKSNGRTNETTMPTRENTSDSRVTYTIADSDVEVLIVELPSGEGKLWRGLPFAPDPYIDVTCQLQ